MLHTSRQGRIKVFTTGQARFNPEHYVINAWADDKFQMLVWLVNLLLCAVVSLSNLQITLAFRLLLKFCTIEYLVLH